MKEKYLIEIFLPLFDNKGKAFDPDLFSKIKEELIRHFGGLTCHAQSPASGIWKAEDKKLAVDKIIIYEIITDHLDRSFWAVYKGTLEHRLSQESIIIRSTRIELL